MSLDLLYGADIEANYRRQVFTPKPAPETSFSLWSMAGAGLAGFPGAGLEVTGSAIDLLGPADRAVRSRPRPAVLQDQPAPRQGEQVTGDVFRAKAAEFAPDPQTAHVADQVMYGLTRFGAKAAAAMLTGGPLAGSAVLAAEETNTAARGLMEKGVDTDTAILTGMVQGVVNAAGVALPVSGAALPLTMAGKAAATAGLVAVGGPGSFVAQEVMARDILKGAGYDLEAATHDPTNPLGLALSVLLPGLFGAVAMRGAAKSAKAMTAREEAQAAADAAMLDPARLPVLRDEIANPLTSDKERARLLAQVQKIEAAAKQAPEAVDAARVVLTERALTANLPDRPDARGEVLRAMDEVAAGRMPDVMPFDDGPKIEIQQKGDFLSAVVDGGEVGGKIFDGALYIKFSELEESRRGQGLGVAMYRTLVDEAFARGLRVFSDITVETPAVRVYEALQRRGYEVERRMGGDIPVSDEAPQGGVFGPRSAEAAFEVRPGTSKRPQSDAAPPPRAEAENQTPRDDAPQEATAPPEAPHNAIPRDLKAEAIALRKAENLLAKLLECVT